MGETGERAEHFPVIAEKNNGKYAVFCGFRKNGEQEEAVLLDPESENHDAPNHFTFLAREQFESDYTGSFILLKKTYRLSDESQPFSLRWFIPEFIKNKGIFGEIALMVAMLTVFSLIVPLFFQIVVDKVLVNQAYNTLNVLGIGILLAVLFNGLVNYVRSYLLLFATNKIDISTATKTFTHLMRLPVDFFERVPSGVLLKHMPADGKNPGISLRQSFFHDSRCVRSVHFHSVPAALQRAADTGCPGILFPDGSGDRQPHQTVSAPS